MTGRSDLWSSFDHDPRSPDHAGLRASDADRDLIRGVLATAYADGRLDRTEFDERSEAVAAARTLGELPPVISDLVPERAPAARASGSSLTHDGPDELRRRAELAWESERRNAIVGFFGASLVCWAIWTATSFGNDGFDPYFPWPLIVMAVSLANAIRIMVTKKDLVRDEVRRLERKQAKQRRPKDPEK